MSRSRWVVLLGPPFLVVLAAGAVSATAGGRQSTTRAAPIPGPVTACRAVMPSPAEAAVRAPGEAWWRRVPVLDGSGVLTGWRLSVGLGTGPVSGELLPAESAVSGPEQGRVVVAVDDGARSEVRLLDVAARCESTIEVGEAVARLAIAEPIGDGVLVHLLQRETRADLGTWHLGPDGHRTLVAGPVSAEALAVAGITRVWSTNVAATRDGRRLAVQSCDPDRCLSRIVDRTSGAVTTIAGGQGDVIGFSGHQLVTMAACHGIPCGVLAWDDQGAAHALADSAVGAAVTANGRVVIAVPDSDGGVTSVAVDPQANLRYPLAGLAPDMVPIRAGTATAGIETGPDAIGLIGPAGQPSILEVLP